MRIRKTARAALPYLAMARSGHALAVGDQVIVSATNFLTTVLIGRFSGPAALGVYSIGFTLLTSCLCVLEALISTPYTVQRHHARTTDGIVGASLMQTAALSAASAALLMAAAGVSYAAADVAVTHMLWVLAVMIPGVLLREFARRIAFAHLHMEQALLLDLAAAALQLCTLGWLLHIGQLSTVTALAALGAASTLSGLVWLLASRTSFTTNTTVFRAATRAHWRLGRWLFATQVVVAVQGLLVYWLLVWRQDTTAAGVFTACTSIVLVSNPILLGFGNYLAPKSAVAWAEGGRERLLGESRCDAALLVSGLALFCAAVLLFGDPLIRALYKGPEYAGNADTVSLLAIGMLAMAVGMPANNALISMQRPQSLFWTAVLATSATAASVWGLVGPWGPMGAAVAVLIGNIIRSGVRWSLVLTPIPFRNHRKSRPDADIPALVRQLSSRQAPADESVLEFAQGLQAKVFAIGLKDRSLTPCLDADIVVKLYHPETAIDVSCVHREAELLTLLHENLDGQICHGWAVCTPLPIRISQSPVGLAMTRVPGTPVGSLLEHGGLPSEVIASLAPAIVQAMRHFWSRGRTHGDLTLDNILCDPTARTLSFVDPGMRTACPFQHVPAVWSADTHDLAHMLQDVVGALLHSALHPVGWTRKSKFAEMVVEAFVRASGPEERQLALQDLLICTRQHLDAAYPRTRSATELYRIVQRWRGRVRLQSMLARVRSGESLHHPSFWEPAAFKTRRPIA